MAPLTTMNAGDRLELFFSQWLDGFFFMTIDGPASRGRSARPRRETRRSPGRRLNDSLNSLVRSRRN